MVTLTPELADKIKAHPHASLNLILRVQGDLGARAEQLERQGWQVKRRLSLINALAVSGVGTKVEALVKEEWVISIEEDKPVKTQ